ncbi:ABC transporter ATP-binding protein [Jiella mangrovi]|uniref:ABC transporter ATP-binding protein n=1 Tax=Jiella mangrovi TaxID=2821407 RepID=A0ABS4BE47_9HYPH|nr:ABC transporter ATP-binding protein [Jiella mangrovi]MBP0615027.1 ABC transporter ATP-binding protein [Jiella mangrovi]
MTSAVEIETVTQRYGEAVALDDVSLTVPAGSFTVLLGPSGSGKTTLLSLIGGFLPAQTGSIRIGGKEMRGVPPARRPTATVFQDYALFPHMTIAGNVGFGLRTAGVAGAERRERTEEMLRLVGLPDVGRRKPHALSGGQKQRIALARALAVEPRVLLLDEPLGALDLKLRRQMQAELTAIHRRVGSTFIHVTHDQEEAMAIADTVVVMDKGRIADLGTPEDVYLRPRSLFAAGFVGLANILQGRVAEAQAGRIAIETVFGRLRGEDQSRRLKPGDRAAVMLRPEHLSLAGSGVGDRSGATGRPQPLGDARLDSVTFMGAHRMASLLAGDGQRLTLQLPQEISPAEGELLSLAYDPARAIVLPEGS